MKRIFFLIPLILGIACNSRYEWVDDLDRSIKAYDKNAQPVEEAYQVNSGTSTSIFIEPYQAHDGIRKTIFRHARTEVMYFERHIYQQGEDIVYEHHVGTAPRLIKEEGQIVKTSDYMVFNKHSYFKNDKVGKRFGQQKLIDKYVPKDSVPHAIKNLKVEESYLYHEDYLEIKNYLKDILALQRVEE
ncbi:hypothetical protein [Muricauda sp. MAR_2010_75]|jgi:hypothetical protein|uniref:hypothetical protein n=1 Tax=Allomuricauda sp. MAR_2010_75 TaxID=1250232 RepID=UPI00056CBEB8|nr:hypothetical protein [Muricauda sp. MAR_2010_75]